MKINFQYSSGDPMCSTIEVYTNNLRPFCVIDENSFFDIMTDRQYKMAEKGIYTFNMPKEELFDKSIRWHRENI